MKYGGGGGDGRKRLQTNPWILKTSSPSPYPLFHSLHFRAGILCSRTSQKRLLRRLAFSQQDSFPPPRKFVCFLLPVKLLLFKKTDTFFYQLTLHLLDANPITVKILFFPVSRNQYLAEMCMHFELQVGSSWINLAESWSNCCQIAHLQNRVWEF